jgi:hypothetical protein
MGRWGSNDNDDFDFTPPRRKKQSSEPRDRRQTATASLEPGPGSMKDVILDLVLEDPLMRPQEIVVRLNQKGIKCSVVCASNVRREYLDTIKLLKRRGFYRE